MLLCHVYVCFVCFVCTCVCLLVLCGCEGFCFFCGYFGCAYSSWLLRLFAGSWICWLLAVNVVLCGIVSVSMSVCRSCRYASCVSCFVVWMFSRHTESPKRFLASFSIVVIMVGVSCFALISFMIIDSKMRIFSASFPSSFCLFL